MSWAQENKFLTGVIAVTVLGAGALGYMAYGSMSQYEEASAKLDKAAAEKKRLETLPVYPNAANLKLAQAQKQQHLTRIQDLQRKLKTMEIEEEKITPEGFQDRLRAAVTNYNKAAAAVHMTVTPKYLGFDQYQVAPPRAEAVSKLDRQLKAIQFVLDLLPKNGVILLKELRRDPLPEEGGKPAKRPEPPKPAAKKPGTSATPDADLVSRQTFEITFTADQTAVPKILNAITQAKQQFYIPRTITVVNEKSTPPQREGAPAEPPPAPPTPTPAPTPAPTAAGEPATAAPPAEATGTTTAAEGIKIIVGEERVEATMLIEIVDFAAPPEKVEGKGKKK